jgi:hypothetical protein
VLTIETERSKSDGMKTSMQEHGNSGYHYGKAKMIRSARSEKAPDRPMTGKVPPMQRRVMPGDAHAAMRGAC